ncbi:hypothetical protein GINT2_000287 [Glugoides intestinalis]
MRNLFMKYYFCGLFKYIQAKNGKELEKELNQIGKDVGERLALLLNFKQDKELDSLIYRIVCIVLPELYQTERTIERGEAKSSVSYYIHEKGAVFESFESKDGTFCPSTIISGIIQSILEISGFSYEVLAYNSVEDDMKKVIYTVSPMII